jgi:hypothetical protein
MRHELGESQVIEVPFRGTKVPFSGTKGERELVDRVECCFLSLKSLLYTSIFKFNTAYTLY